MPTRIIPTSLILTLVATIATGADSGTMGAEIVKRWQFRTTADGAGFTMGNHLRDLRVADNALCMEMTGPDAYFFLPPVNLPLDALTVRIRLRADRSGETDLFWVTKDDPEYSQRKWLSQFTPARAATTSAPAGGDDFVTLEFAIGTNAEASKTLTGLRIDPYNRNTAGHVEIASIELLSMSPFYDVNFAPTACRVGADDPVTFRAVCRQRAGRLGDEVIDMSISNAAFQRPVRTGPEHAPSYATPPETPPQQVKAPATQEHALTREFHFDRPGVNNAWSIIQPASGTPVFDLQSTVIVGEGATLPTQPSLRTDRLRLDLVPTPDGRRVGAARWQVAGPDGGFRQAGWLLPLAELTVESPAGRIVRRQPAFRVILQSPDEVRLAATVEQGGDWNIELVFRPAVTEDIPYIDVRTTLIGPGGGKLLDFSGPVLRADRDDSRVDPLDRFAIFGGMEFLDPGWRSSSDRAVGPKFADRWTPHPFKVALPVMAVEAGGLTSSLMWQPLEPWAQEQGLSPSTEIRPAGSRSHTGLGTGSQAMPAATFASTDFLDGQSCHLMKLSVPSIPQWRSENESFARRAYETAPSRPVKLHYALVGEFDTPAAMAARTWYRIFGLPVPPPAPHDDKATWNLYARHLGETMYWPDEKGWRHYWYLGKSSSFSPWMAAELLAHAAATSEKKWIEATHLTGKTIIDTAGPLADRVANAGPADATIRSMRPDGTWAYVNTPEIRKQTREFTGGQFDSLGEDGSTSVGTCAMNVMHILRYALLTGRDADAVAGIKALEAMRQFRVPRGASVWEIHKDIPDLRAAGLAVEAYQLGYRITGDRRWLDEAGYWAWTGVPFLYSWPAPVDSKPGLLVATRDRNESLGTASHLPFAEAFENPHRQVTPYGSIPEFGPTFYVSGWYGVIVQWCGLDWAGKVIELDRDRPDPLLRAIADGVVASGLQQTFDRPPWVGLYPDVWDTQTNTAQGAFICGLLPIACLQAQGRIPDWTHPWTRILRDADANRCWHISGWGRPPDLAWPVAGNPLNVPMDLLPGQPNELVITGADRPRIVRVGEDLIDQSDRPGTAPGWSYNPTLRAILIRFTQPDRQAVVRVEW